MRIDGGDSKKEPGVGLRVKILCAVFVTVVISVDGVLAL